MGYESKLYVVEKHRSFCDDNMIYSQVIAMFDLCKFYPLSTKISNYPMTDCYFYADDGNTKVLEDRYGEPLREIPIEDIITVLEEVIQNGDEYRRIFPALAALKELNRRNGQWRELVILHYGY